MKPLLWFLAILVLLVVLFNLGFWPIPTILLAGWALFLLRVTPQMQVDWSATSTALACSVLLVLGLHAFLRWFRRQVKVQHGDSPSEPWKFRWTATILAVVLLLFLAGISAVGLTHQVVWLGKSARSLYSRGGIPGAFARITSMNNLRYLGLGSIREDPPDRHLPGVKFDPDGAALHGWLTMLLPHLEQEQLYWKLDLALPWNHPRNAEALRTSVPVFRNFGLVERNGPEGFALSHYAGNIHILGNDVAWKMSDIPDGAGNTILAGEVSTALRPWGYPLASRDPSLGLYNTPQSFGGPRPHSGRVFAMADSSVRMISSKVDRAVREALATPDGGEVIRDDCETMTPRKHVEIWVDGACVGNPGPGGYAAVLLHGEHRREITGGYRLTTNNRMELRAVIAALEALRFPCTVTVHSDARYVVDGVMTGAMRRWRAFGWRRGGDRVPNADLWAELHALCERHEVTLRWVRGHTGVPGNERCDLLASDAALAPDLPIDVGYETRPPSDNDQPGLFDALAE